MSAGRSNGAAPPVLEVRDASRTYQHRGTPTQALRNVSFSVGLGETVAVVGESGAGKSTLTRLVTGLEAPTSGEVLIEGRPPRPRFGSVSPVQMVFQNPTAALNPYLTIGQSLGEPLRGLPKAERTSRVADLLDRVGIDPGRAGSKPSAFSGGQLQRIVIARALAARPRVLVCDEPTSALDVSVQGQVLNALLTEQESLRFACVLVTHDLGVVRVMADYVVILKDGVAVEQSGAAEFFASPATAYGQLLCEKTSALSFDWPSTSLAGRVRAAMAPDPPPVDR